MSGVVYSPLSLDTTSVSIPLSDDRIEILVCGTIAFDASRTKPRNSPPEVWDTAALALNSPTIRHFLKLIIGALPPQTENLVSNSPFWMFIRSAGSTRGKSDCEFRCRANLKITSQLCCKCLNKAYPHSRRLGAEKILRKRIFQSILKIERDQGFVLNDQYFGARPAR